MGCSSPFRKMCWLAAALLPGSCIRPAGRGMLCTGGELLGMPISGIPNSSARLLLGANSPGPAVLCGMSGNPAKSCPAGSHRDMVQHIHAGCPTATRSLDS